MQRVEELLDPVLNSIISHLHTFPTFASSEPYFITGEEDLDFNGYKESLCTALFEKGKLNNDKELLGKLSKLSDNFPIFLLPDLEEKNYSKYFSSKKGFYGDIPSILYSKEKERTLYIGGYLANYKKVEDHDLKVCAILSTYNEEDIIEQVCTDFINQGIYIHAIDNWSTDRTFSILKRLQRETGMVSVEFFPESPSLNHEWEKMLRRKEEISAKGEYDWYFHTDADEIRESPWDCSLLDGIKFVDSLGFNVIDFAVLDFRPVKDGFDSNLNPAKFFNYFELGKRSGHFVQQKAWKWIEGSKVDLASSGGHTVSFDGKKIFPFTFLLRHYPLRSIGQMEKKIYKDRLPRFALGKRTRGWHVQYDKYQGEKEVSLWKKNEVLEFDESFNRKYLLERLFRLNIEREI